MIHYRDTAGRVLWHGLAFDDAPELVNMVCEAGSAGKLRRLFGPEQECFGWTDSYGEFRDLVKWYGRSDFASWADVAKKFGEPWPRGMQVVEGFREKIEAVPFSVPRERRRRPLWCDDSGGELELDRFMSGADAFSLPSRVDTTGRQFVTVIVDNATGYNKAASSALWRAVVACVLVERLEAHGYGVGVYLTGNAGGVLHRPGTTYLQATRLDNAYVSLKEDQREHVATSSGFQDVTVGVWVKRHEDALDTMSLVSACSPWFFRLMFLGSYCLIPGCVIRQSAGYALELDEQRTERLLSSGLMAECESVVVADCWTESEAVALLRGVLLRFSDNPVQGG